MPRRRGQAARHNDAMKQYLDDAMKAADQGLRAVDMNAGALDQLLAKYDHPDSPVRHRPAMPQSPDAAAKKELAELEQFLSRQTASLDRMSALPALTPKTAAMDEEIDSVLEQVLKMEMADKKDTVAAKIKAAKIKKAAPAGGAYRTSKIKTSKKRKEKART